MVRQLIVTGLEREAPTVIVANDAQTPATKLISHYARVTRWRTRPKV